VPPDPALHPELVVLVDSDGRPCGTAPKHEVHHDATPLHLAFSCWVIDGAGRTLLTRRARVKRTWPGIWTNSFCGHPGPGEQIVDAVHRRAAAELGTRVSAPALVLPDFRYRAVMSDGTVENEICPVFTAELVEPPVANPDEVDELRWMTIDDLRRDVATRPAAYSPWMREQLELLPVEFGSSARAAGSGSGPTAGNGVERHGVERHGAGGPR
jgi:isopentenyl-diphosphate delta-isomerase